MAKRLATRTHRTFSTLGARATWRAALATLVALATAGVLAGCGSAPTSSGSGDASSTQQGTRGITVFGDIDAGVTRQRSR